MVCDLEQQGPCKIPIISLFCSLITINHFCEYSFMYPGLEPLSILEVEITAFPNESDAR